MILCSIINKSNVTIHYRATSQINVTFMIKCHFGPTRAGKIKSLAGQAQLFVSKHDLIQKANSCPKFNFFSL